MSRTDFHLRYLPALDGVRAIAILAVFIFHCRIPGTLRSGFVGVDIFFVLSGFLITSLLLQERRLTGKISLGAFYLRRAIRLLPALFVMLTVFLLVSYYFFPAKRFDQNVTDSILSILYVANWREDLGYRHPNWLAHTWSLSLEEQFYVIWPILFGLLLRKARDTRQLITILLVAIVASWLLRIGLYYTGSSYKRVYHGIDTRADALLAGALLAVIFASGAYAKLQEYPRGLSFLALCALLILFGISSTKYAKEWWIIYGFSIAASATVLLIAGVVAGKRTLLHSVLEYPAMVWLGRISYGLYLWHYPIIRIMRHLKWEWPWITIVSGVLTLAIASLSFYFIEQPLLRYKPKSGKASQG